MIRGSEITGFKAFERRCSVGYKHLKYHAFDRRGRFILCSCMGAFRINGVKKWPAYAKKNKHKGWAGRYKWGQ